MHDQTPPGPGVPPTPQPPQQPAPASPSSRRTLVAIAAISAVMLLGGTGLGFAAGALVGHASTTQSDSSSSRSQGDPGPRIPQLGPREDDQSRSASADTATAEQEKGLVYVNTVLDYGVAQAAGTGMVLSSDGTILTNHHVVESASRIEVEVISTGDTYEADVVGYDDAHDVAVLKLRNAKGLDTVTSSDSKVEIDDKVTAVGNANGDGGAASAAVGTVTGLNRSITAVKEDGTDSRLTGLIEIDADVIAGDSGGAVYNSDGEVVGMTTAASTGSSNVTGYAVPIAQALDIADQILAGDDSDGVHIGDTAFFGVGVSQEKTAPTVVSVFDNSPAEAAGITVGSVITAVDGTPVATYDDLLAELTVHKPGDTVTIEWTTSDGQTHSADAELTAGPVG